MRNTGEHADPFSTVEGCDSAKVLSRGLDAHKLRCGYFGPQRGPGSYDHRIVRSAVKDRSTHDVALDSPSGVHVELHYDLVEEGRAKNAIKVLSTVWQDATPRQDCQFFYEMSDAFFYFYHIAHMAKHFETGGCDIRPFLDLWILDHMESADHEKRNVLLEKGGLKQFADVCRKLSRVWFEKELIDPISLQMQGFLLRGGTYGTVDNRVMLQQKKQEKLLQ